MPEDSCTRETNGDAKIGHVTGYKDDYKVEVELPEGENIWSPTNDQIFKWITLWFQSEDHEFGDGYGRWMPFFYVSLIALGYEDKAFEAYQKRGYDAVRYFEDCVDEHADELIAKILELKDDAQ